MKIKRNVNENVNILFTLFSYNVNNIKMTILSSYNLLLFILLQIILL